MFHKFFCTGMFSFGDGASAPVVHMRWQLAYLHRSVVSSVGLQEVGLLSGPKQILNGVSCKGHETPLSMEFTFLPLCSRYNTVYTTGRKSTKNAGHSDSSRSIV